MPKSNRELWVEKLRQETLSADEHIYSQRFLAICRDEVNKCAADPAYDPPPVEEVMGGAPWGP